MYHMSDTAAAPDLSKTVPRSGRHMISGWSWLARLADKVRAEQAGKAGEYVAYCPLSMGFLNRAGISREEFDRKVRSGASDQELAEHFETHAAARKEGANRFVLEEMRSHLDDQDAEEGHASA
jgi:hypothetical protein